MNCIEGCFPSCPDDRLYSEVDNDCVPRDICMSRREHQTPVDQIPTVAPEFEDIPIIPASSGLQDQYF